MTFNVTPTHEKIFAAFEGGDRNMLIEAVAGSGKTSTVIEATKRTNHQCLFLAFNKDIANELKARTPSHVEASTLNSLGFRALMNFFRTKGVRNPRVDGNKTINLGEEIVDEQDLKNGWGPSIKKLVGLGKALGVIPRGGRHKATHPGILPDTDETWDWIIERWNIELPDDENLSQEAIQAHVVGYVRAILDAGLRQSRVIDFDDQLYMSMAFEVPMRQYSRVVVDECQDLNAVQRYLAGRSVAPGGIICGVGDPCQSIYGFRGADSESMANFKAEFDAVALPLHVSYRCPQAVVREAQKTVSHIKAFDGASEGLVEPSVIKAPYFREYELRAGDMVVCRKSAPLMTVALSLLKEGTPAKILGRAVGEGLIKIIDKQKTENIDDLDARLLKWRDKQTQRLSRKKGSERKIEQVQDQVDCIRALIEESDTVHEIRTRLRAMFSDATPSNIVTLCTIHKSKGLESDRVFILNRHEMPSKIAKKEWELEQERNLIYVATTRAKQQLGYIRSN